jgi:hypothetical protein
VQHDTDRTSEANSARGDALGFDTTSIDSNPNTFLAKIDFDVGLPDPKSLPPAPANTSSALEAEEFRFDPH